jgi:crotonobetainyl-CoA:carnitine CoA-transferase CaiB-like acyl-CoA transferase
MRPLKGLRVLDFSTLLPGPLASLLLAEAGADVIKVERPEHGDDMRNFVPRWGEHGVNFALLNRGKRSVSLDLKNPDDRRVIEALVPSADVLIEQFRPGAMANFGLDYESVGAANARLIYCSITGYGQTGPKRANAGHDLNYIGDVGLLALSSGDHNRPVVPPALIADIAAGAYPAFFNILLALRERELTGRGCHLDISMTDGLFPFLYWALGAGMATGKWPGNGDALTTGGTPRYRLYRTADNRFVAAAPIEQKFWLGFCSAIGLPEYLRDDALNPSETTMAVCRMIEQKSSQEWRVVFSKRDCCCTIVATLEEAMDDPHFKARGIFDHKLANGECAVMPALPLPIDAIFRASTEEVLGSPRLECRSQSARDGIKWEVSKK